MATATGNRPDGDAPTERMHSEQAPEGDAKIRRQRDLLRVALAGLVGADTVEELETMEAMIRLTPAPDADKAAMTNAIHALLEVIRNP